MVWVGIAALLYHCIKFRCKPVINEYYFFDSEANTLLRTLGRTQTSFESTAASAAQIEHMLMRMIGTDVLSSSELSKLSITPRPGSQQLNQPTYPLSAIAIPETHNSGKQMLPEDAVWWEECSFKASMVKMQATSDRVLQIMKLLNISGSSTHQDDVLSSEQVMMPRAVNLKLGACSQPASEGSIPCEGAFDGTWPCR